MSNGWMGRGRHREVDWGRRVRADHERTTQTLWILVGINVFVFVLWSQARGTVLEGLMVQHFLVSFESVAGLRVWTLITSTFSHVSASHLLFNMIGLYVFGRDVGMAIGARSLVHLYLMGGIMASAGHVIYSIVAQDPTPALGASGSVMALAVLFGAMFPNRTLLINFFIPIPAALAVAGFILMDILGTVSGGSNIAHAAHLGGAAYGLAYWYLRVRR